ncbi:MAG: hypothetical protein LBB23_01875 [Rickettsiales bacterium]|nr:hypothetical protein [Rickettsiales bacterium]
MTTTPCPSGAPLRQRRGLCAINKHQPPRRLRRHPSIRLRFATARQALEGN